MHHIYKVYKQKCSDNKSDTHIALLQIRLTPLGPGLPNPATLLFNQPKRSIMPIVSLMPISPNNDGEHYGVLAKRETKKDRSHDTSRNYDFIQIGSIVVGQ